MKNWLKSSLAAAGVLVVSASAFALTGCGSKSHIKNNSSDVLYNGGIVSVVGNDLVFVNGYNSAEISSMDDYKIFAETGYLATTSLSSPTDRYTGTNAQKLNSENLGFANAYSFVYGDNIYYAAPNKHKTSSNTHLFNYLSFFRCGFDGKGAKEFFTTTSFDSAKSQIRALKFQDNAYWAIFDGKQLNVINLNNNKVKLVSEEATSVALPREGEDWNGKILFTENKKNEFGQTGNAVKEYNVASGETTDLNNSQGQTVAFTGRTGDDVFYSLTKATVTNTRLASANEISTTTIETAGEVFYSSEISSVYAIGDEGDGYEGYLFSSSLSGNAQMMYMKVGETAASPILKNGDYSTIFLTNEDLVYYSTTDGIYSKNVVTKDVTTIVKGMTLTTNMLGYDFTENGYVDNIYFYAQREYAEDDETKEEDRDKNVYMFTTPAHGQGQVKLVSKTK